MKGCKVVATANEINRLSKPLQSRFRKLFLSRYTEPIFSDVSEKVLRKSPSIARHIGANVWKNGGDIRDVISIGKLVKKSDGPEQIEMIIDTMSKYGRRSYVRDDENSARLRMLCWTCSRRIESPSRMPRLYYGLY